MGDRTFSKELTQKYACLNIFRTVFYWNSKVKYFNYSLCYKKVKLTTVVEGDQKAPFSIATTPRCRRGRYFFPGLLHFTLDTYVIFLSVNVTMPPLDPRHINFFEPFHFLAGDQLVVPIGASHISLRLQEIQSREREKKNKRTIRAWG